MWSLEAISASKDEGYAVAASKLSGHRWSGCVFVIRSPANGEGETPRDSVSDDTTDDGVKREQEQLGSQPRGKQWLVNLNQSVTDAKVVIATTETTCGNVDVKWLSSDRLVVANDCGQLQLWSFEAIESEKPSLKLTTQYHYHDDIVQSLAVRPGSEELSEHVVLTGSWDNTIKLWKIAERQDVEFLTFSGHHDIVWDVAWSSKDSEVFASVGQDQRLLLWDSRQPEAISAIRDNVSLTSVAFDTQNSWFVSAGGQDGTLKTYDTRALKLPITTIPADSRHPRQITKIAYRNDGAQVSFVSDDLHTRVYELPCLKRVLDKQMHKEFPRGLTWSISSPDILASCGWDGVVVFQRVPLEPC